MRRWHGRRLAWLAAFGAGTVATAVMIRVRANVQQAHVVLVYLLLVLAGGATGGRPLGFTLALLGFGAIDYWFQLPYDTLTVAKGPDWFVLLAFLAAALITTQLLARAQARENEARHRAAEVERLNQDLRHAEAMQEAARFRDALVSAVSHDFRTPLTTIRAIAEEIAATQHDAAAVRAGAVEIREQTDRLVHLVENLLDFSRIRVGALPQQAEVNTAEDLIGAAVRQCRGVTAGHAVQVDVDLDAPALTGFFDFTHALRALTNLIENAAKHSPPGSPIRVTAQRERAELVITVADRGQGVEPSERERIFAPFYRPQHASPDVGGTGLGLAIARELAHLQGGSLTHEDRVGGGSRFVLRLPGAASESTCEFRHSTAAGDA